jgi:hypothetical protein
MENFFKISLADDESSDHKLKIASFAVVGCLNVRLIFKTVVSRIGQATRKM